MITRLAVTWWGHSSATIELGPVRVGTDPLLVDRLGHLRRHGPSPTAVATDLDLVLISHLHGDHLHVPSLRRVDPRAPIVVPRGAGPLLAGLGRDVVEVVPGDRLDLAGVHVEVLAARHDDRRHPLSRTRAPALGFRVDDGRHSFWYPGDTGSDPRMADVEPVDLALVPIGGWGPTLPAVHLGPEDAVAAVVLVGATYAMPVHHGTFWPVGLRRILPANHRRLFVSPGPQFVEAMQRAHVRSITVLPEQGDRELLIYRDDDQDIDVEGDGLW